MILQLTVQDANLGTTNENKANKINPMSLILIGFISVEIKLQSTILERELYSQ
ncbi:hypothetical protein J45TS6_14580 [Paenibacillus sp. J45TS6]|nr:hypothetical protein J45TS6_14580 [Paenibacillus sp. J45TS6]